MLHYTEKYDENLKTLAHYQQFPQMLPFIGENYDETKLLVIGESHYLPEGSKLNANQWYNYSLSNIQNTGLNEYGNTNPKGIISHFIEEQDYSKYKIYRRIRDVILKAIQGTDFDLSDNNIFHYLTFYNFFQRPAQTLSVGLGNLSKKDTDIANNTFEHIIDVIKPKFIFFATKRSWNELRNRYVKNADIGVGTHPTGKFNCWGKSGKQKFLTFLKKNNIF